MQSELNKFNLRQSELIVDGYHTQQLTPTIAVEQLVDFGPIGNYFAAEVLLDTVTSLSRAKRAPSLKLAKGYLQSASANITVAENAPDVATEISLSAAVRFRQLGLHAKLMRQGRTSNDYTLPDRSLVRTTYNSTLNVVALIASRQPQQNMDTFAVLLLGQRYALRDHATASWLPLQSLLTEYLSDQPSHIGVWTEGGDMQLGEPTYKVAINLPQQNSEVTALTVAEDLALPGDSKSVAHHIIEDCMQELPDPTIESDATERLAERTDRLLTHLG